MFWCQKIAVLDFVPEFKVVEMGRIRRGGTFVVLLHYVIGNKSLLCFAEK